MERVGGGDDGGEGVAEVEFAGLDEAVGFGDEGGGDETIVMDGLHAFGSGDAGGGGNVPA